MHHTLYGSEERYGRKKTTGVFLDLDWMAASILSVRESVAGFF
jgi:hypothetical protein